MSVESEQGLAYSFKKMVRRAPSIFQGKPILNVEVAQVNEHTYYRLKFGRYKYLKNAKADCEAVKRQGIDCWVSNYTNNRVYF
nr:SPOR domain-containing protein [Pseudoalteromonas shioyasakiensis]